jgi:transposase-like protein
MRTRRRYTESQKAEALAFLVANGNNVKGTARQCGIPERTLAFWRDEDPRMKAQDETQKAEDAEKLGANAKRLPGLTVAELRALKKDDLASAYEDVAWMGITKLREGRLIEESNNLVAVSTATATSVDKMRLLKGESTVITEQKLANHRWAEEELQKVMREFQLTREQALEKIKELAPTWAGMLM